MFKTEQQVVILLTTPDAHSGATSINASTRYVKRGLAVCFKKYISIRHTRRILKSLERKGVLKRKEISSHAPGWKEPVKEIDCMIKDFNKAFQNIVEIKKESSKYRRKKRDARRKRSGSIEKKGSEKKEREKKQ